MVSVPYYCKETQLQLAHRSLLIGILAVVTLAFVAGALLLVLFLRPHSNFAMLLEGYEVVVIKRFEVEGQGRRIVCANQELRRVLNDAMHQAEPVAEFSVWRSYVLKVWMEPSGTWKATIYVAECDKSFVIAFWEDPVAEIATFSDPQHYQVVFPETGNEYLEALFDALKGDRRGTITIGGG
jgi:hypothetical protein